MKQAFKITIENLEFVNSAPEFYFETKEDAEIFVMALNASNKSDKKLKFKRELIEVLDKLEAANQFLALYGNDELPN